MIEMLLYITKGRNVAECLRSPCCWWNHKTVCKQQRSNTITAIQDFVTSRKKTDVCIICGKLLSLHKRYISPFKEIV